MDLLEIMSRRWTLRIIWELRNGPLTSRALRAACDNASPTVLQARLTEMRAALLVELRPGEGYALTALGREFQGAFLPLYLFADRWAKVVDETPTPG